MSEYSKTIFNHKEKCLRRIKDIFSRLIIFGLTHKEYLEMRNKELFQFNSWKRLPIADREYLRGFEDSSMGFLYRIDLIWLHYCLDDKGNRIFYDCFEAIPREKPFKSGYFWAKSRKPFTINNVITVIPKK